MDDGVHLCGSVRGGDGLYDYGLDGGHGAAHDCAYHDDDRVDDRVDVRDDDLTTHRGLATLLQNRMDGP